MNRKTRDSQASIRFISMIGVHMMNQEVKSTPLCAPYLHTNNQHFKYDSVTYATMMNSFQQQHPGMEP